MSKFKFFESNKLRYIKLRNKIDGSDIILDTSTALYDRIAKGFLNTMKLKNYFVKHIVLTQAKESYKPKILSNFMTMMKRKYGKDCVYIWTVELQEKRFEETGDAVLHWHIMYAFPYEIGLNFKREDIEFIAKKWKYGLVKITPVRKMSLGYLMKYIKKELSEEIGIKELFDRVRRIGTSVIPGYMKQGFNHVLEMLSWFALNTIDPDEFYWYKGSAYLYLDEKYKRGREYIYKRTVNWEFIDGWNEEAF